MGASGMRNFKGNASLVLSVLLFCFSLSAQAANTDPNAVWPLCGRITDNPPVGWVEADGCPTVRGGDAAFLMSHYQLHSAQGLLPRKVIAMISIVA